MKNLFIIVIALLLTSCGASHHLKRAKFHIAKAEALGAQWERQIRIDTIYKDTTIYLAGSAMDGTFGFVDRDTVTLEKNNVITKVVVRIKERKIYINTTTPPDTIKVEVKVPCETAISNSLSSGYTLWQLIGAGLFSAVLTYLITMLMAILKKRA